jgi:hypothetical protein
MIGREQSDSKSKSCVGCGCRLTEINRSMDTSLCNNCWMVNLAEIEAEDRKEDAISNEERIKRFLE